MSTFEEAMRAHGLRPSRAVVPDNRWHRCPTESHPKKRNGAWRLAPDQLIGWFRDFAVDAETHVWRPEGVEASAPRVVDMEEIRRREREARANLLAATNAARAFYAACKPLRGGHPYLESHGLGMEGCYGLGMEGCYGLRINPGSIPEMSRHHDTKGWIAVPMHRRGTIVSLQLISPDGEKLFWRGASPKGASYVIDRQRASLTVLCEGLATGLALFAAVPTARVVVAFTAGNLEHAELPASGMLAIAADNDHRTVCQRHRAEGLAGPFSPWAERPEWCLCNPGRRYAEKLAAALGVGVALPDVRDGETDWCDVRLRMLRERWERRKRHERDVDVRRSVDAEIAVAVQRAARFRVAPSVSTRIED